MKYYFIAALTLVFGVQTAKAQELPKATVVKAVQTPKVKIHTLISPNEMFANATQVIELPHELIVVDGQFFAPYGQQVKELTESLKKPVTRFYISHDHPDHYIGFGDAFPDVPVYALKETKESIEASGQQVLEQRQSQFGPIIAKTLRVPTHIQKPGKEIIDGVTFLFEESLNNEDVASLVIKIPEAKANIVQDIIYEKTHLFLSGSTEGWRKAIKKEQNNKKYTIILPGHGKPSDRSIFQNNISYLDFVEKALAESKSKEEFKNKVLTKYPNYAGDKLIDIYLEHYLKIDWSKR